MSLKTFRTFKSIAPSCVRRAVLPALSGRMFASARFEEVPCLIPNASRAHLTARCPHTLAKPQSTVEEERPLPTHQPDPFAFMTPLRAVKPLALQVQQEILNGRTAKDPGEIKDQARAAGQENMTKRLVELLQQAKDSLEDCEDRTPIRFTGRLNIPQDVPRRSFRPREDRPQVHPVAKDLGPPEAPKPSIQGQAKLRLRPTPSATFMVSSRYASQSSSSARLRGAPRSTSTGITTRPAYASPSTTPWGQNTREQSIIDTVRPFYKMALQQEHPHPHPVNVVRPDIPPLNTTPQLSEKILRLQSARDYQMELSEKEHKSRAANCVAWIKRRIFR